MTAVRTHSQLCTFRLDDLYLGVDVLGVQEVLRDPDTTRVPRADPATVGLLNLRGQITTVIDLRQRLGLVGRGADPRSIHVIVRSGGESVSLLVDRIGDVVDVAPERYEPSPANMTERARELILGAYKLDTELLLLLDVGSVIGVESDVGG